jgi:2-desacetyl-2-hydroxyethyl bacteriochlorophyllide A dehydrogenase
VSRLAVYFTAPRKISLCKEGLPSPADGQILVKTLVSAISPGTELLIYRGRFPTDVPVDETISALDGAFSFPLKYGYAAVGRVVELGPGVNPNWQNQLVFAFQPHQSHFLTAPDELLPVPANVSPQEAAFLPNIETAINFLLDGQPLIGERVAVFGQGVVGLLTTALLAQFPLDSLVTLDQHPLRRNKSQELGALSSLDPTAPNALENIRAVLKADKRYAGADLTYELSGNPTALDQALAVTGFDGRIVIGSWYGQKRADLNLGGRFHRSRIRLIGSQVSSLPPSLGGRWTKTRRLNVAWRMIRQVKPAQLITHLFPIRQAGRAYALLDERPEEAIQVLLTYGTDEI